MMQAGTDVVAFTEVTRLVGDLHLVHGHHLELPTASSVSAGYFVALSGWVVGAEGFPDCVEIQIPDVGRWTLPVSGSRPDIRKSFPASKFTERALFSGAVGVLSAGREFEVRVLARFGDTLVPLARLRATRRPLPSLESQHRLPVVVTTLGRTGGNWLLHLLGSHPDVLTWSPFLHEARVLTYWLEMASKLAQPAVYDEFLQGGWTGEQWVVTSGAPSSIPEDVVAAALLSWLGRSSVEQLMEMAAARVNAFYDFIARIQNKEGARFFTEKMIPGSVAQLVEELWPTRREVFLVRDFRDVACSSLAYSRKRNAPLFGLERCSDEREFIRGLHRAGLELLANYQRRRKTAMLVRYEDLVQQPEAFLRLLFSFLQIDSRSQTIDDVLARARNTSADLQIEHTTSSSPAASIGRWQHDMDSSLAAFCNDEMGDLLTGFGYTSSGQPPRHTSRHAKATSA